MPRVPWAWWGGGVAVGVQTLTYSVASTDPASLLSLQSALGADNLTPVSESSVSLGYGRSLFGIDFGATLKLVDMRLGAARSGSAAFDAGAATDLGPARLAVSVQNLGGALELPRRFVGPAGTGRRRCLDTHPLLGSARLRGRCQRVSTGRRECGRGWWRGGPVLADRGPHVHRAPGLSARFRRRRHPGDHPRRGLRR